MDSLSRKRKEKEMDKVINSDKRNAIPSWSGYQYQGQIAIITMLIELVNIPKNEIDKYALVVEDIEDFSIYYDGKLKSIHQVKAQKKKVISSYAEALYYMALGLENIENKEVIAYLHTSEELQYNDWENEVINEVESFVPKKKTELEELLQNSEKMQLKVEELRKSIAKSTGKVSRRKGKVWNAICDAIDIKKTEDINEKSLEGAIRQYLDELKIVDIQSLMEEKRIQLYEYDENNMSIGVKETEEYIEKGIEKYWGEELSSKRKGSSNIYRLYIQEIIEQNVTTRHENKLEEGKIPFKIFVCKLEKEIGTTEEQRILENKDMFFRWKKEFCDDKCNKIGECVECDLARKEEWISGMSLENIKNVFYMMSPDITDDISKVAVTLVHENGLFDSFFLTLKSLQKARADWSGMVLYEKSKRYWLTDIEVNRKNQSRVYEKLSNNTTIEKVCTRLMNNHEFGAKQMEIDSLIIFNGNGEEEIENIENLSGDTGSLEGMRDKLVEKKEREPSYKKITHKKPVSLIDAGKFIKDCGGEIDEQ